MAYTVWGAFDAFKRDSVDLTKSDTDTARTSRDHLFDQLKGLNGQDSACPKISSCMPFGSFARRTKIKPLNDIDLLAILNGSHTSATVATNSTYEYWLKITSTEAPLNAFRDDYGYVNSTKVLNQIKKSIPKVRSYYKADLNRNQQAIILDLLSYSWVYDIVPAVPIASSYDKTTTEYYLIPDGTGDWMRTDPRRDTQYLSKVAKGHDGYLLQTMRLLKYWNWRTHKPRLASYHFETLVLNIFANREAITSLPQGVADFFYWATVYIDWTCPDPKGLGPNLDANLDSTTRGKIKAAMQEAERDSQQALAHERRGETEAAINKWKRVFGPSFPSYGL